MSKKLPSVRYHDLLASSWKAKYRKNSFRKRFDALTGLLEDAPVKDRLWLDAGCGVGILAFYLGRSGAEVIAVDASKKMIEKAEEEKLKQIGIFPRVVFKYIENIEENNFPADYFDGVLCSSVIEYLENPIKCLVEFKFILKNGAILLISVPNKNSIFRRFQKIFKKMLFATTGKAVFSYLDVSKNEYTFPEFSMLLTDLGFSILEYRFTGTPFPEVLNNKSWCGSLCIIMAKKNI